MVGVASLAIISALFLSNSTGLSSGQKIRHCPSSSLICEKSDGKDSEYVCRVGAPHIPGYDPPRFKWSVTAGKVIYGHPTEPTRIIDVSGVDAEVVTVVVEVRLGLPGCESTVSWPLKLR